MKTGRPVSSTTITSPSIIASPTPGTAATCSPSASNRLKTFEGGDAGTSTYVAEHIRFPLRRCLPIPATRSGRCSAQRGFCKKFHQKNRAAPTEKRVFPEKMSPPKISQKRSGKQFCTYRQGRYTFGVARGVCSGRRGPYQIPDGTSSYQCLTSIVMVAATLIPTIQISSGRCLPLRSAWSRAALSASPIFKPLGT